MPIRVEIYGATGVAVGIVSRVGRLREILETGLDLLVEQVAWHPLDGSPPQTGGSISVAEDDILLAVADRTEEGHVHAQWHDIELESGPYRVRGQMPTMPGFDPGRALARPSGEFVLLRDVRIALISEDDGAEVEHAEALVNRYCVDRIRADLMLGFFFPGAEMTVSDGLPPLSVPARASEPIVRIAARPRRRLAASAGRAAGRAAAD